VTVCAPLSNTAPIIEIEYSVMFSSKLRLYCHDNPNTYTAFLTNANGPTQASFRGKGAPGPPRVYGNMQ